MSNNNYKPIIDGFEDDFQEISKKFLDLSPQLELVKFLDFWNNERLDCLFANRYDPRELVEAITHMNERLVDKVTNTTNQHSCRIVALYFLFCLYLKQPSHIQRKVRITCRDALTIQNLVNNQGEVGDRNAKFVWNQLRVKRIIQLVEERRVYGPSMLRKYEPNLTVSDEQTNSCNPSHQTFQFFNNHIISHLNELECLLSTYEELRDKLKLDAINDPTVEINSSGTLVEFINQAKDMLINLSF